MTFLMLKSDMYKETTSFRNSLINYLRTGLFNMQTMKKAFEVSTHYDTGEKKTLSLSIKNQKIWNEENNRIFD